MTKLWFFGDFRHLAQGWLINLRAFLRSVCWFRREKVGAKATKTAKKAKNFKKVTKRYLLLDFFPVQF
jgi:hypothetical protein